VTADPGQVFHIFLTPVPGLCWKEKRRIAAELRSGTLGSTFAQWLQNHGFACPKYCSVAARQPRFACPK